VSRRILGIPPILSAGSLGREEVASLVFREAGLPQQERNAQLHEVPPAKALGGSLPGIGDLGFDEATVALAPPLPPVIAHRVGG